MCTVTIIPKRDNDFILTSNRDEAPNREALTPDIYTINDSQVLFPKDKLSEGTWVGVSDKNRMVCVLNGAFEFHKRKSNYRKSRGVVAKEFMLADDIIKYTEAYNFEDIEPFTMVIADWNSTLCFYELVWDSNTKYFIKLPLQPRIWSSSTLYDSEMRMQRQSWFDGFINSKDLNAESLMIFHKTAGTGNLDFGVIMNRGFVKTTSITQVEKENKNIIMRYEALKTKVVTVKKLKLPQVVNG